MITKAVVSPQHYPDTATQQSGTGLFFPYWSQIAAPFYIAVTTLFSYIPSLHYSFLFDDLFNIKKNFAIRHNTLSTLFFANSRWVSGWLNTVYYKLNRFDPFFYRLGNLCFHITTAILLFLTLNLALKQVRKQPFIAANSFFIAFTTALLFALHPVQTQTVSYVIQGQLEGLAGLSIISLVLCFLLYTASNTPVSRFLSCFFLFSIGALSCGTKEIVIISPLILLLVDWFFVAQGSLSSLKSRFFIHGFFALTIISIFSYFLGFAFFKNLVTFQHTAQNNFGNIITQHYGTQITAASYFISQFKVIVHYAWIFIWPFSLSVDYDWRLSTGFFTFDCLAPLLLLCSIFFLVARRLRACSVDYISFGILWFFIAILPRSSIMPSSELLADYKTYVASIGLFFMFALASAYTISYAQKQFFLYTTFITSFIGLLIFSLGLGYATYCRNLVWSSGEALWSNVVQQAPVKARGYNNLAIAFAEQKKYREAISYYKKAIELDARYPDPLNNIANVYADLKDLEQAIWYAKLSLLVSPYQPEIYHNLSNFYITKRDYKQALEYIEKALQLKPNYGLAYLNKGRLYYETGNYQESYQAFKKSCLEADQDTELGFTAYAESCVIIEKYEEAISAYKKVLELNPKAFDSAFRLANVYYLQNNFQAALPIYQELIRFSKDPHLFFKLGDTHAKLAHYQQALTSYQEIPVTNDIYSDAIFAQVDCLKNLNLPQEAKKLLNNYIASGPPELALFTAKNLLRSL